MCALRSGRVCSLELLGSDTLLAGDCSSSLKRWDLRAGSRAPQRLANAPGFAGDACPTAGLWADAQAHVVAASSIAWWTQNRQVRGAAAGAGAAHGPAATLRIIAQVRGA